MENNDMALPASQDRAVVNGANELSPPLRASVPSAGALRERINKVRDGYASQMKFCDIEAAGYFREFVRRIDAALADEQEACQKCDDSGFQEFVSGGIWAGENITTRLAYCDCYCGQVARDKAISGLVVAINAVMDNSGARGQYHALKYTEAVEALESILASISITAKAMEARQGRDGEAGSVHDSAVPKGFAQGDTP